MEKNSDLFLILTLQATSNQGSYLFTRKGYVVVSHRVAVIKVPINIKSLEDQLAQTHDVSSTLRQKVQIVKRENSGDGYLAAKALSFSADSNYLRLNDKYSTALYFFSRKRSYKADELYKRLKDRIPPAKDIVPDTFLKRRNVLIPSKLDMFTRRAMPAPDDSNPQNSSSTASSEPEKVEDSPEDKEEEEGDESAQDNNAGSNAGSTGAGQSSNDSSNSTGEEASDDEDVEYDAGSGQNPNPVVNAGNNAGSSGTASSSSPDPANLATSIVKLLNMTDDIPNPFNRDRTTTTTANVEEEETFFPRMNQNRVKRDSFSSTSQGKPTIIHPYSNGIYLRVKRQFVSIVAGLLTSIGVSSIFGGIDASRISTIDSRVDDLADVQAHIVHDVKLNSDDILVNRNMLNGMNDVTQRIAKLTTDEHFRISSMLIFILLEAEYSRIDDLLNQYLSIINAAQKHQFHPATLSHASPPPPFKLQHFALREASKTRVAAL